MKAQFLKAFNDANTVQAQRVAAIARIGVGVAISFVLLVQPAAAQSLKQSGITIFNAIYGIVGIVGAIACLLTLINWMTGNWLGREDPRKTFFTCLMATALAFGVVGLIQFIKDSVGGSASGISNL